jgi:hypothetical protein
MIYFSKVILIKGLKQEKCDNRMLRLKSQRKKSF